MRTTQRPLQFKQKAFIEVTRFLLGLLALFLFFSILGTLLIAFIALEILVRGNELLHPTEIPKASLTVFALWKVIGADGFVGTPADLGAKLVSFFAPFLITVNIAVALLRGLTNRRVFPSLDISLKWKLLAVIGFSILFSGISIMFSRLPPETISYSLRIFIFTVCFSMLGIEVSLLHGVNKIQNKLIPKIASIIFL